MCAHALTSVGVRARPSQKERACVCARMCACVCEVIVCARVRTPARRRAHACVCDRRLVCVSVHTRACVCACVCACMCTCGGWCEKERACVRVYAHVCGRMYACGCARTCVCGCAQVVAPVCVAMSDANRLFIYCVLGSYTVSLYSVCCKYDVYIVHVRCIWCIVAECCYISDGAMVCAVHALYM